MKIKILIGGAGLPKAKEIGIIDALNEVASHYILDAAAIAAIIYTESKWDTRCITGSYVGLTQVGPDFIDHLDLSRDVFLSLSATDQIRAYGKWLEYYSFTKKFQKLGIDLSTHPIARQAAVLQAMQFSPNGAKWKTALANNDLSVPATPHKQAKFLGDTSIQEMEAYYEKFFRKHPPVYDDATSSTSISAPTGAITTATNGGVGKTMIVATEGLYFRATPEAGTDRNIIAELDYGDLATVTGAATSNGYVEALVSVAETETSGYLHQRYLRDEQAEPIERALREAVREWRRFEKGNGVEYLEPFASYINEYWRARGMPKLTGKDRNSAWSAVFISFILEKAGYEKTKFDIRHSTYIHQAIQNRVTRTDGDFWGFRFDEAKPEVGDLVCQWRVSEITYEKAETRSQFPSHTDIIVAVRDRAIITLGGNVASGGRKGRGESVETKTYELNLDGFLTDSRQVFAILKNRHRVRHIL